LRTQDGEDYKLSSVKSWDKYVYGSQHPYPFCRFLIEYEFNKETYLKEHALGQEQI
jgi:hypothetical protein